MNLYHLKYFYDAIQSQSLTIAAKTNFVSQSAVTQAIRSLEVYFESPLITHQRRQLVLTAKGEMLYVEAEKLLKDFSQLTKKIQSSDDTSMGEVIFGCTSSFAINSMQHALTLLKKNSPKIKPILKINYSDIIKEWIKTNEIEFGIIINDGNLKDFQVTPLSKGYFVVIAPKNIKLTDYNFMVTRKNKKEVKDYLKVHGKKFKDELANIQEILSWEVIKSLVTSGHGKGLVPDYMLDDKVKVLEAMGKVPYELVIISNKNKTLSPQASNIVNCFLKSK